MKDWKFNIQDLFFYKKFSFKKHQKREQIDFTSFLLQCKSDNYSIDITQTEEGFLIKLIIKKDLYKISLDNILNSIDLTYKGLLWSKK